MTMSSQISNPAPSKATTSNTKLKYALPVLAIILLGAAVKKYFFKSEFLYAGTLEATKVELSAQLPSTLKSIGVQEGDAVSENQELINLACEDVRVAAELAKQNFERNLRLFHAGTVSQDALDQIKNRKEDVDVKMGWCVIRSPIRGTVLNRYHEPGEWVSPGMKLMTLANIRDIWTIIYVPQAELATLKVGMQVSGTLPEIPEKTFYGKIIKINSEAEFTPKNVQTRSERTRLVFGVKINFQGSNEDEILKPGMTIEVQLPKVK